MHATDVQQSSLKFRLDRWFQWVVFCSLILARLSSAQTTTAEYTDVVYQLSPFDLVSVSVYGQDDLESEQRITDKGHLFIPLLGEVPVGGLTVSEAAKRIRNSFISQQYLRDPVVTISIKEFAPKVVTVLGEVEKPGSVEIPPGRNGIPVQIAIAGAGGFTGTAKITEVRISSGDVKRESQSKTIVVNMSKLLDSKTELTKEELIILHPDDIVFVPRRVF